MNKIIKYLLVATGFFSIVPFLIYYYELSRKVLPDPEVWYAENNHGPWRYQWEGMLVFTPLLILFVVTFAYLLKSLFGDKVSENKKTLVLLGALLAAQVLVAVAQLWIMGWTKD